MNAPNVRKIIRNKEDRDETTKVKCIEPKWTKVKSGDLTEKLGWKASVSGKERTVEENEFSTSLAVAGVNNYWINVPRNCNNPRRCGKGIKGLNVIEVSGPDCVSLAIAKPIEPATCACCMLSISMNVLIFGLEVVSFEKYTQVSQNYRYRLMGQSVSHVFTANPQRNNIRERASTTGTTSRYVGGKAVLKVCL